MLNSTSSAVRRAPSLPALKAYITAALLIPLALFALAAWYDRGRLEDDAQERATRTAIALAEHAHRVFAAQYAALRRVDERTWTIDAKHLRDNVPVHDWLKQVVRESDYLVGINITGPDSYVILGSSYFPTPDVYVGDRSYFQTLAKSPQQTVLISQPIIARPRGIPVFQVATSRSFRNGHFNGTITASVSPDELARFYRQVAGPGDSIALVRADGIVLARFPSSKTQVFPLSRAIGLMQRVARQPSSGSYQAKSALDGIERLYAYRKVGRWPVYVNYGASVAALNAQWREDLIAIGGIAGLASLLLLSIGIVAIRRTERERAALARAAEEAEARAQAEASTREASERAARAEAELALRASEERLRDITDAMPVLISYVDAEQRFQFVNKPYEEWFDRPIGQIVGHHLREVMGDNVYEARRPYMERALAGEHVVYEAEFPKKEGHRITTVEHIPHFSAEGHVLGFYALVQDVTDQKHTEAALRDNRDRLAGETAALEVLNRTGSALAGDLDLKRIMQTVTDAGVELAGAQFGAFFYDTRYQEGEGSMIYTLSAPDRSMFEKYPLPRATKIFEVTMKGEGILRSEDITKDPRYGQNAPYYGIPEGHPPVRSYLAVPVVSRMGNVLGGLLFGHEMPGVFNERSERVLVGLAAQGAVAIDNARLFEAAQREVEERRRVEEALRQLNETLEARVEERTSELMRAEEALRQSQKMEAIGQLTGGVAHDFNNLLTIIRSSADLLRRTALSDERRRRYVDAISDTADRAAKLTGQLLAFARRQALKPEIFNVTERVRAVAEMLSTVVGSHIRLEVDADSEDCFVKADAAQLETALVNLAVNARDAMRGEGVLTMRVRAVPGTVFLKDPGNISGEFVAVSVADTGHGIGPDKLPHIFEPFFTTKEAGKGTGLGLSQVYGFAKQSGGEVQVETEVGQGTTFTLYLPRADAVPETQKTSATLERRFAHARVLVVEDNPAVGEFSTQMLRELGHATTWAPNAETALQLLEQDADCFDLVFSDVVMPGMSGIELGQIIRRRYPQLSVVLTSGYSHVLAEEGRHGFELLQKPYSVEGLSRVLSRAVH